MFRFWKSKKAAEAKAAEAADNTEAMLDQEAAQRAEFLQVMAAAFVIDAAERYGELRADYIIADVTSTLADTEADAGFAPSTEQERREFATAAYHAFLSDQANMRDAEGATVDFDFEPIDQVLRPPLPEDDDTFYTTAPSLKPQQPEDDEPMAAEDDGANHQEPEPPSTPHLAVLTRKLPVYKKQSFGRDEGDRYASVRRLETPVPFRQVEQPSDVAAQVLRRAPHAAAAIEVMATADRQAAEWGGLARFQPVLLVGPPGCGKSTVARIYHEAAGIPVRSQNVAGMPDALTLLGTHRTYWNPAPSCVLETVAATECANPCIILDEVDKAPKEGRNGAVVDALLGLLEPSEAERFVDLFLDMPADVSHVRWVLTANKLDRVPEALRSRCQVVHVPSPRPEHVPALAAGMIADIAAARGISPEWFGPLDQEELAALTEAFVTKPDMRQLRRLVERVLDLRPQAWGRA